MSASGIPTTPTMTRGRAGTFALWGVQVLLSVFFLAAAALPKLLGQQYAVQLFDDIGAGHWLRYLVGTLELAGAIGLLIPRLAGLAALGLVGLMLGAAATQVVVLHAPVMAVTPVILGVLAGVIARARWSQARALLGQLRR